MKNPSLYVLDQVPLEKRTRILAKLNHLVDTGEGFTVPLLVVQLELSPRQVHVLLDQIRLSGGIEAGIDPLTRQPVEFFSENAVLPQTEIQNEPKEHIPTLRTNPVKIYRRHTECDW